MQPSDQHPLSISRHTIQHIWQTTLSAHNPKVIGLLGSQRQGFIDTASHLSPRQDSLSSSTQDVTTLTYPSVSSESLSQLSQRWASNHTRLSGVYQCEKPTVQHMKNTEELLFSHFKLYENVPFIHLYIHFDVKGVLQSQAWILQHNQANHVSILLSEDGQSATKS